MLTSKFYFWKPNILENIKQKSESTTHRIRADKLLRLLQDIAPIC